jgi:hypothetical protein
LGAYPNRAKRRLEINFGKEERDIMKKVHFRNLRLRVNIGIDFPECKTNAFRLDLEKSTWAITGDRNNVTCKKCIEIMGRKVF